MSFSLRLELLEHLPRILREWRSSRIQELLQILRAAHQHASHSDLHLATTVFGCVTCQTLLVYPQVFYHRCCFNSRAEDELSHDRMQTFDKLYYGNGNGPWSARTISFHSRSSQFAEKIVINAGLDPATATVSDLTVARPVIEHSNLSADVFPTRIFVNWQAAVGIADVFEFLLILTRLLSWLTMHLLLTKVPSSSTSLERKHRGFVLMRPSTNIHMSFAACIVIRHWNLKNYPSI